MRAVCFGECMIELSRAPDGAARVGYGGDTLNTAIYLARLGVPTRYMSALGADPWSQDMVAAWAREGVDVSLALTHPVRAAGLYAISTDAAGERSFTYWRAESAARAFFTCPGADEALAAAANADLLYLSGITLAIFTPAERQRIATLAGAVRGRGGAVAFDPNWRPRLWTSPDHFRAAVSQIAPAVTIALPGFADEAAVWGDASPDETLARWRALGVGTVVVKAGADGALTADGWARPAARAEAVDSTGAGDSFNAGFLASQARGLSLIEAARFGGRLAAEVVRHPGAIIPAGAMPALDAVA